VTEESPIDDVDQYEFPDKYFEQLHEYDGVHEGYFSIVQGGLYRAMVEDTRFTEKDAMQVSRLLNNKEVSEAEDLVYNHLEGEI